MKTGILHTAIAVSIVAAATAAPPLAPAVVDSTRPDGTSIVAQSIEALGGAQFLAMHDRVARGWSGLWRNGVTRHAAIRIDTLYGDQSAAERHTFDKKETHWLLFNDKGAHEITYRGYRPLAPERAAIIRDARADNVLQVFRYHSKEPGFTAKYRGMEVCEKQSGYLVDIAAGPDDPLLSVCFSQVSMLPIRQTQIQRDPVTGDRVEATTVFSRYTDAGGVQWPRHIARLLGGEMVSELFLESVAIDQGLSQERFTLPHDLEKLK